MTEIAIPATRTATVPVLHEGYVGLAGDGVFSHHHPVNAVRLLRGLATVVIPGHGGAFRPCEHA